MCLGCMFVGLAAMFPRIGLLIIWLFTDWMEIVFDTWFWPLLGIIFLPFATLMYVIVDISTIGDFGLFGWLLIGLGAVYDVMHWAQIIYNRQNGISIYNRYGPGQTASIPTD